MGTAPYPVQTPFGTQIRDVEVKIDEEDPHRHSQYHRRAIFQGNQQSKARRDIQTNRYTREIENDSKSFGSKTEEYKRYAVPALLLALLALFLQIALFRQIP